MQVKNIDWIKINDSWYGDISGLEVFTIFYEDGYYWIYSNLLFNKLQIDEKYLDKKFRKLEKAKIYCENVLMKEVFDLFFKEI